MYRYIYIIKAFCMAGFHLGMFLYKITGSVAFNRGQI